MLRLVLASLLLTPALAVGQEDAGTPKATVVVSKAWYPSEVCVVRDRPLEKGKAVVVEHDGETAKVCCKRCAKAFKGDPEKYLAKLHQRIITAQKASYPLETCVVSGKKLGAMGDPHDIVVAGRLVRLCCKGCVKKARKNADATLAKIGAALCATKGDGAASCPVSGKTVKAGKGVNLVYGNDVIRLCCKGCIKKFEQDPTQYTVKGEREGHGKERDRGEHGGRGEHDKKKGGRFPPE